MDEINGDIVGEYRFEILVAACCRHHRRHRCNQWESCERCDDRPDWVRRSPTAEHIAIKIL